MKQLIFVFILLTSCLACANNRAGQTEKKEDMKSTKEIYLAGGCFWGTEHFLKLIDGVEATQVGYANGNIANPTYKQVCTGTTDFAETVKVQYDPVKVDLPFLIDLYFKTIDPTSVNKQGNDRGTQYRTGIYYTDPADLSVIQETVHRLAATYTRPLAVEMKPLENFYPAEEYHQNYLEKNPDLVKRMRAEGHIIGNHSYHHPDMSQMGKEEFQKELAQLEDLYEQTTGEKMSKFYRPPQGKYSDNNLQLAKELGYRTIFWSLAYVDWKQEEQPTREEAMSKLLKRVHPGAIVLLHNTSRTNGEILDEVLTKWEEMGYHFASLEELVSSGSREARSFFLTDNQENPVKSAAPTHAAGSQKQARGKLTSFMAISAVIMRANSSATPPIIGRKL